MNETNNIDTTLFQPFPKMARLNREVIVTEKLDGTNAQIYIVSKAEIPYDATIVWGDKPVPSAIVGDSVIFAGSRTRWIYPGKHTDNYGFAGWVKENAAELIKLGPGRHFGEWWGGGIQRGYGMTGKRFSLFNVGRWFPAFPEDGFGGNVTIGVHNEEREWIKCCYTVPVIWRGSYDSFDARDMAELLRVHGSFAAPGFMKPEGIVLYHTAAGFCFKVTLEGDEKPKGLAEPISSAQLIAGKPAADEVFRQKCE